MSDIFKLIGIVMGAMGAGAGMFAGLWHVGDVTGYRPALKYELDYQGFFNRRLYLRDRIDSHVASPREIGEFCGLSLALNQPLKPECGDR